MVNAKKCFKIVFAINKKMNIFAPKFGHWFSIMALLQFFIFDTYGPGSNTVAVGNGVSHYRDIEARTIGYTPLLEHSI